MSKLLIEEPPIQVLPRLAKMIGLNKAIALQQLHYWLQNPNCKGEIIEGVKWIYNNYENWQKENFPFWSISTIQRTFAELEKDDLIVSMQPRKNEYNRTKYYRIRYNILNDRSCQFDIIEDSKLTPSLTTETTTETTFNSRMKKSKGNNILETEVSEESVSTLSPQTSPKPKREPTPEEKAYKELEEYFIELTGLPVQAPTNEAGYKAYQKLWKSPGKEILGWVSYDLNKAKILVKESVDKMRKDNLTIASFNSISKVAVNQFSQRNVVNNGHHQPVTV